MKKDSISYEQFFVDVKDALRPITVDRDAIKNSAAAAAYAKKAGQVKLSEKIDRQIKYIAFERQLVDAGITHFITRSDFSDIRIPYRSEDGQQYISYTKYEEWMRAIPEAVIAQKLKVNDLLKNFTVYHYWDEKIEQKRKSNARLTDYEMQMMRDPVLFGSLEEVSTSMFEMVYSAEWTYAQTYGTRSNMTVTNGSSGSVKDNGKLYLVGEWEDEYCDLSFDKLVEHLAVQPGDLFVPEKA